MSEICRSAELSSCGKYRYRLYRSWGDGPFVVFVMFNPSTADAEIDDPTIRKCIGFAKSWGINGICVVNLFAFRSTDPRTIGKMLYADAVGPKNDEAILTSCATASEVVFAWGCGQHMKSHSDRVSKVRRLIRNTYPYLPINCLGKSKDGQPRHPLMLSYSTAKVELDAPKQGQV